MIPVAELPPPPPPYVAPAPSWARGLAPPSLSATNRERVDPGQEPSDFNAGDWDLKVRLGFAGNGYGPQTIVTAFFNWFELQLCAETGLLEIEYLSLGLGVEAWIGRPWIPEVITSLESDGGSELNWRATSRGVAARFTAHYTWLSSFDPYLVAIVGPTSDMVRVERRDRDAIGKHHSFGMRLGLGGGIHVVTTDRILLGGELRYLIGTRFTRGQDVPIVTDGGMTLDTFDVERAQRPPRGLSWVATVGVRL